MPCYNAWYEHLTPGTSEFAEAKEALTAKLHAVTHVVDYYYAAHGLALPALPDGVAVDPMRQPRSHREYKVRELICHHLSCDGVDYPTLFDLATLLDERDKTARAYLAVIRPCSMLMKQHQDRFVPAYAQAQSGESDA